MPPDSARESAPKAGVDQGGQPVGVGRASTTLAGAGGARATRAGSYRCCLATKAFTVATDGASESAGLGYVSQDEKLVP